MQPTNTASSSSPSSSAAAAAAAAITTPTAAGAASAAANRPPLTSFRKRRASIDFVTSPSHHNSSSNDRSSSQQQPQQPPQSKYFNEKELAGLAKQFTQWTNKQHKMDRDGFRKSLGLLGMVQDALLCHQLFRVFNKSNTGQIDFEEYCDGLGVLMKGSMEEKLDFSFNMTDMDGSGAVSFQELVLAVDSMRRIYAGVMGVQSPALDQEKVRRVFKVIDSDGDGRISLDEYKTAMKSNPEFLHTLRGIELFRPTPTASLLQANKRIAELERAVDAALECLNQLDDADDATVALSLRLRAILQPAVPLSEHARKLPVQEEDAAEASRCGDQHSSDSSLAGGGGVLGAAAGDSPTASDAVRGASSTTPLAANANANAAGGGGGTALGDLVAVKSKGAVVSFGHKNWDLVVNVMKGIQMAVSRSAMEADRDVSPYDYSVKEKYTLVSTLDPELQHDASNRTRFVDYAPFVFAKLRQHFDIDHEEYMNSIGPGSMLSNLMLGSLSSLSELGSEGKSGSFFYLSSDNRFLVKTIRRDEHKWLRHILPSYYRHMTAATTTEGVDGGVDSLLTRMVGCHVVRRSSGTSKSSTLAHKVYFVVMTNALISDLEMDRRYDLKGSWVGRRTQPPPEDSAAPVGGKTLKDLDFRDSRRDRVFVNAAMKAKLMAALRRDVNFLEQHQIIDYSVLLGVHDHTSPVMSSSTTSSSSFTAFHGGFLSQDGKQTYLVGIIDFLTRYSKTKQMEHAIKTVAYFNNRAGISVMPARAYAKRFLDFMESTVIVDENREAYFVAQAQAAAGRSPSILRRFSL